MTKRSDLHVAWLLFAICALLWNSLELGQAAPPAQGLLGMTLSAAQSTDFFTFFRLEESWRERDSANRAVVVFHPGNAFFRKLVVFRTTLNSQNRIVQVELDLARSFIDNGNDRIYANDIAKSLLADGPSPHDITAINVLITEIGLRGPPNSRVLNLPTRPLPKVPTKESPGYLTYIGMRQAYTQELSASMLHMENMKQQHEDWLQIRLLLKP